MFDLLEFLNKNKGIEFTTGEIAKIINVDSSVVCKKLKKLIKEGKVNENYKLKSYTYERITRFVSVKEE